MTLDTWVIKWRPSRSSFATANSCFLMFRFAAQCQSFGSSQAWMKWSKWRALLKWQKSPSTYTWMTSWILTVPYSSLICFPQKQSAKWCWQLSLWGRFTSQKDKTKLNSWTLTSTITLKAIIFSPWRLWFIKWTKRLRITFGLWKT